MSRYKQLPADLYVRNRKKFTEMMEPRSLAVFNSNDIYPISADSTLAFQQHRDIFYLTGVDQEESVLLLFPDAYEEKNREILFVRETNEHIAIWEGEKLTKEKATQLTGIENVQWLTELDRTLYALMTEAENLYLNINEHYRNASETQTREDRFIRQMQERFPLHPRKRSNPILQQLRAVKEQEELDQIARACEITEKGYRRALEVVRPGIMEYEIEAEFAHVFLSNGSRGFAYTPIIASGNNANVLHYIQNDNVCQAGDLILLDVGAEYGNYASDMSRMIPVDGKFSERQKEVYDVVLKVKDEAAAMLVPGNNWYDYHKEVGKIMTSALLDLGLLDKKEVENENADWPAYKKYFMHGTSHHMGLDTHDYGLLRKPFEPNMVFTVEPGIYIPDEGFGIRIEDDYVVQASGNPINLMENIPITTEEIEEIMNA